jgi:hypothetical protein
MPTLFLQGSSMCGDVPVNITPVEDYELPPEAYSNTEVIIRTHVLQSSLVLSSMTSLDSSTISN